MAGHGFWWRRFVVGMICGLMAACAVAQAAPEWSYTGKVLRADDRAPLADVQVALFAEPCTPTQGVRSAPLIQKTGADGTYRFEHVVSGQVRLLMVRAGFTSGQTACESYKTSNVAIADVVLYPAFAAEAMQDGLLDRAYPERRKYLAFRAPQLSADGMTLQFVTLDGYANEAPEKAWSYDLKSKTLSPQPLDSNWMRAEQQGNMYGPFEIDDDMVCHGCNPTLSITNSKAVAGYGPSSVTLTRNETIGYVATPDASAVFWGENNSKGLLIFGMYETSNRKKRYVVPPWTSGMVTLLATRRVGGDYLLVYSVAVGCAPDLQRVIETMREPYPENQFAWHQPWHVCFARVPASDK